MSLDKGNIAELEFILQATKMGLVVSRPVTQATIYDFLVDNSKRILKVQVKSTFSNGPNYGMNISHGSGVRTSYNPKDVDIMACFLADLNRWYIIPIAETGEKVKITLIPNSADSKWNKFKGCWDLLLK